MVVQRRPCCDMVQQRDKGRVKDEDERLVYKGMHRCTLSHDQSGERKRWATESRGEEGR